jgi:peroxiredoxin Q/BCP
MASRFDAIAVGSLWWVRGAMPGLRPMAITVGQHAPDFELESNTGELVRLSDVCAERVVVLFFYPKDDTPGCTAEACLFRDRYSVFAEAGAEVLGVSSDSVASHRRFVDKYELCFRVLADTARTVRRAYGVKDSVPFLVPGRATFVIDRERVVQHHFRSQLDPTKHVHEALRVVEQLAASASDDA